MANLMLKRTILEVVDNQLKANDPPCTKEVYERLLEAGYSKAEAKDKIGAVILEEIYDILKEGQTFDEEAFRASLEEMLQQSIDYEDDHHIDTEWDQWDELVENGYESFSDENPTQGLAFWKDAWELFCSVMEPLSGSCTLEDLMESQDYDFPFDGWLQDYEMELGNAARYRERIAFCQKVLELFDWEDADDSCFQCGIGESLFRDGRVQEAYDHYEKWLAEDPQNVNGLDSFSWILVENNQIEKAYDIIRRVTWGVSCTMDNFILFSRAKLLADEVGKDQESKWYQQQMDKFHKSLRLRQTDEDLIFDEFTMPKQIPVVKDKKIYPNDPCPCGSGKKYKKCCGKA